MPEMGPFPASFQDAWFYRTLFFDLHQKTGAHFREVKDLIHGEAGVNFAAYAGF
jgi:hypothetical protein